MGYETIVILADDYETTIITDYSVEAIAECFENDGYCILHDIQNEKIYMVTPKSIFYSKTELKK